MSASPSVLLDLCCCIDLRCSGTFPYVWLEMGFVQEIKGTFRNVWGTYQFFLVSLLRHFVSQEMWKSSTDLVVSEAVFGLPSPLFACPSLSALLDSI
jgi:hypothetical protein